MFDIGFLELILVSIIGLLVLGPERLPGAIRTASLYVGKLRRSFNSIRSEIERELKADEIRQDLHNQSIMQELRETEKAMRKGLGLDGSLVGTEGDPIEGPAAEHTTAPDSASAQSGSTPDHTPADAINAEAPAGKGEPDPGTQTPPDPEPTDKPAPRSAEP